MLTFKGGILMIFSPELVLFLRFEESWFLVFFLLGLFFFILKLLKSSSLSSSLIKFQLFYAYFNDLFLINFFSPLLLLLVITYFIYYLFLDKLLQSPSPFNFLHFTATFKFNSEFYYLNYNILYKIKISRK